MQLRLNSCKLPVHAVTTLCNGYTFNNGGIVLLDVQSCKKKEAVPEPHELISELLDRVKEEREKKEKK